MLQYKINRVIAVGLKGVGARHRSGKVWSKLCFLYWWCRPILWQNNSKPSHLTCFRPSSQFSPLSISDYEIQRPFCYLLMMIARCVMNDTMHPTWPLCMVKLIVYWCLMWMSNARCVLSNVRFVWSKSRFVLSNARFVLSNVRFVLSNVRFVLSYAQFVLSNVRFVLSNVRCVLSNTRFILSCPVCIVKCPVCIVKCPVCIVKCSLCIVNCSVCIVKCTSIVRRC